MKKLFSTIFATLLSLSLILTGFTFTVQADDLITETEKISCNATLDDNFADIAFLGSFREGAGGEAD